MMAQQRCLAGLDVGSETTCAVLIELSVPWGEGDVEARVLGVGEAPTAGVRNRVVTNMDAAVESIRAALRRAEQDAGVGHRDRGSLSSAAIQ